MSQVIQEVAKNANLEVISISQKNIGINLRSTPLTYMNVFAQIRQLFAKKNKVSASLFSYNSKGAYPHCHGKGVIISEMSFMDDIVTTCEVCHGSRYKSEVIKYKYHSKTIVDILKMIVQESNVLFADELFAIDLATLSEVGLGYLRLNQSLTTLSGGELQRLKLASQLHKKGAFYVLDKPTDGLHLIDVKYLLNLVNRIVDEGNTVLLVEHNIEVLKQVGWSRRWQQWRKINISRNAFTISVVGRHHYQTIFRKKLVRYCASTIFRLIVIFRCGMLNCVII